MLYLTSTLLQREHALAVDVDVDVAELDPVEQVAAQAADRHGAVHVLLRLTLDEPAQPVAEPRRLRRDQRERDDADEQRPDEGHDLQGAPDVSLGWRHASLQHDDLERLADREMEAVAARLGLAVDEQAGNAD